MTETAAARLKRVAKAREALHAAGERWHKAVARPGPYESCQVQTCYRTHRMVAS